MNGTYARLPPRSSAWSARFIVFVVSAPLFGGFIQRDAGGNAGARGGTRIDRRQRRQLKQAGPCAGGRSQIRHPTFQSGAALGRTGTGPTEPNTGTGHVVLLERSAHKPVA